MNDEQQREKAASPAAPAGSSPPPQGTEPGAKLAWSIPAVTIVAIERVESKWYEWPTEDISGGTSANGYGPDS
jgi:hypothetical protein